MIVQIKWKGAWKFGVFRPMSRFILKTAQDTAIVRMEDEWKLVYDLQRMASFSMTLNDP